MLLKLILVLVGGAMLGIQSGADTPLFLIKNGSWSKKFNPIIGEFEEKSF